MHNSQLILLNSGSLSVVPGPGTSSSSGTLLEMHILRPIPLSNQKLCEAQHSVLTSPQVSLFFFFLNPQVILMHVQV